MAVLVCAHRCGVSFDVGTARQGRQTIADLGLTKWHVETVVCPNCRKPMIVLLRSRLVGTGEDGRAPFEEGPLERVARLWPKTERTAPPEVPLDLARDYQEAGTVLGDSPRAAAALARRCLQLVLVDHMGATGRDLVDQIDSVEGKVPEYVFTPLHAVRNVGNFAAHPIKSKQTGDIVDVEPGEAEWLLDTLDAVFEHVFVAPKARQDRLAELNKKLADAGKPTLGPDGKPVKTQPAPAAPSTATT
jgi:hypothetical protein